MDFAGTFFTDGTGITIDNLVKILRLPRKKIEFILRNKGYARLYRIGRIDGKTFWKIVRKKLNISEKEAKEIELMWHRAYKPNKGMEALAKKLIKKYKVVAVSGNTKERVRYLKKKYHLDKFFNDYFFSFDYGTTKPESRLVKIAIKKLKVKPGECLLIDDLKNFSAKVKKMGCKTILFKNAVQTERELKKLRIL